MKHHLILLFFFLVGFGEMEAQYTNNFWVFGDSVGINWTNSSNPSFFTTQLKGRGTSVSLSDSTGVLIYSGTGQKPNIIYRTKTFNKFHLEITNSDSINGEGWYHEMLLIPHPGNDSLVYLISIGVTTWHGLFYTLINYKANNDSGIVIQKNVQLQNVPAFDGLTAVRHGNGRDWWVLFKKWDGSGQTANNNTYKYLINVNGISLYSNQSIGSLFSSGGGQCVFNNTNDKLVHINWRGLISFFNFDRCSGQLSQPIIIDSERPGSPYPYFISCAFSPDDTKLYVISVSPNNLPGENDTLFQYDLTASNISASRQTIFVYPTYETGLGNMKLAPDNKIYITATDEIAGIPYPDSLFTTINNNLSVINYPDSLGAACDFQPFSFNLGAGRTYFGLPNNPDYELGAWVGSPCDTLRLGLSPNPSPEERGAWMQAWFNHEWNMIHVNASKLKGKSGVLRLFDVGERGCTRGKWR
ncbi:MAG: hypothetical protein IPK10_00370 [Bacteroidetes bacterium]|nr:hypothetical protein [Bacteroidota bacterium]